MIGLLSGQNELQRIWRQKNIPVIFRKGTNGKVIVRVPYSDDNMVWLRDGRRNKPQWNSVKKYWELPYSWFNDIIEKCLERYKKVFIIQPFRKQERCAPACWNAKGHICSCSCMGANHGVKDPNGDWFVVSDTFAAIWHQKEYACRLLSTKI